ncbi:MULTISPECIES: ABC transporter permease [Sporosarcina]|uniref:ABC transporter permease n=1 Tax=Sporosarcina TaxID=1569 RepID=UPI00129A8918|nr:MULTISPECIES: ABC transporter permease [Sporosarcina]GKV65892.1 peptide ABC transporter [Sporosarcina sp. NCCP-2331]GLB56017.1 peptide ABC transporter [Sporosarcina sp. NCCP-2378]
MFTYILRRLLIAIPVLFGISVLAFFMVRLVPGDTVTAMLGTNYNEAQAEILRQKYGLDQSIIVQYGLWIMNVVKGDLGISSLTNEPVFDILLTRLPITLELSFISILFALLIAIPLGTIAALKRNTPVDYGASFFGMFGISVPNFWLGTLMILYLSLHLSWLPSSGFVPLSDGVWANIKTMIMPGIALGTSVGAVTMRMTRSSMLEVLGEEYMKMAKAKGVTNSRLIWKHGLRNALVPVVTVLGIQAGYLLGGSIIIEQIFSLPGIGQLALQAISNRDYSLLQGTILFIASAFVLINLAVDIIYALINPKIRYS